MPDSDLGDAAEVDSVALLEPWSGLSLEVPATRIWVGFRTSCCTRPGFWWVVWLDIGPYLKCPFPLGIS